MRNDGNGYVPTSMGINLHYLWCKYLVGEPIVHPCNLNTPCYFMADTRDWVHVMKGRVSMKRWLEDKKKTSCYFFIMERIKNHFLLYKKQDI